MDKEAGRGDFVCWWHDGSQWSETQDWENLILVSVDAEDKVSESQCESIIGVPVFDAG